MQAAAWSAAAFVGLFGLIKIFDFTASLWAVFRPESRWIARLSDGSHRGNPEWTPIFQRAKTAHAARELKAALEPQARAGLPIKLIVDRAFRAPILSVLQTVVLMAAVAVVQTSPHQKRSHLATSSWHSIVVFAAISTIGVACTPIVHLLGVVVAHPEDRAQLLRDGGQIEDRTNSKGSVVIPSVLTVPAVAISLIVAFGALYFVMAVVSPGAFSSRTTLNAGDSLYFSVVTAATVGYGEIHPATSYAQLAVASQILIFGTGFSLFVSSLASAASAPASNGE
jgi:hypothetical protein